MTLNDKQYESFCDAFAESYEKNKATIKRMVKEKNDAIASSTSNTIEKLEQQLALADKQLGQLSAENYKLFHENQELFNQLRRLQGEKK